MIRDTITKLYQKFRLLTYQDMFKRIQEKEGSLSATEAFSADVIYLLKEPTLTQFADYIGISQPNATYKVNSLMNKGYVLKKQNAEDKRECRLQLSEKFVGYFHERPQKLENALDHIEEQFTQQELQTAESVLTALLKIISNDEK